MLTPNVELTGKTILITGSAGFVGANLVMELLKSQSRIAIVGYDNVNNYYDVSLKEWRLAQIAQLTEQKPESSWTFV
ncbi:MAG: protein CapI, partial [Victivallales bacterium]|nr:protein CapI [Victivallales bacterium]